MYQNCQLVSRGPNVISLSNVLTELTLLTDNFDLSPLNVSFVTEIKRRLLKSLLFVIMAVILRS